MSIFALVILRGPTKLALSYICAKAVAAQGNVSVEVLLPKGGHGLQLSCACWSAVFGVDADGGTPDLDFTDESVARVAARRCPYWLFAVMACPVSNLSCELDDELRSLRQVHAPNVMIMKRLRYAGKPGQRSWVSGCGLWEAPFEHGGQVPGGVEFSSGGGCLQVEEWMLPGLSRQCEETCSKCRPRWLAGEVGDDLVGLAVECSNHLGPDEVLGRYVEPVGVALDGVEQSRGWVTELAQQCGGRGRCVVAGENLSE
jgi:hypothetical protein